MFLPFPIIKLELLKVHFGMVCVSNTETTVQHIEGYDVISSLIHNLHNIISY